MQDLGTTVLGVRLPFPVMNAPGTFASVGELRQLGAAGAGALCLRTATVHPFVHREFHGLHNPGHDKLLTVTRELVALGGAPIVASVAGGTADEYALLARLFGEAGASLVELNLADPWVARTIAPYEDMDALAEVTGRVLETSPVPVLVRLPTDVAPRWERIAATLKTVGVRGVVVGNDFAGMEKFLLETRGEIEMIAIGQVHSGYDVSRALAKGARAVQVDADLKLEGPKMFRRLAREMRRALDGPG
jgi:dihydroorotate dehydrogenase (NAD+) catalytic subunit